MLCEPTRWDIGIQYSGLQSRIRRLEQLVWRKRETIYATLPAQTTYRRLFYEYSQPFDNQITHVQQQRSSRHERSQYSLFDRLSSEITAERRTICIRKSFECVVQNNPKAGKYNKVFRVEYDINKTN